MKPHRVTDVQLWRQNLRCLGRGALARGNDWAMWPPDPQECPC